MDQDYYKEQKKSIIEQVERGNIKRLPSQLICLKHQAAVYGYTKDDIEFEWLIVIDKTRNFTKHMSAEKFEKILSRVKSMDATNSSFATDCLNRASEYMNKCFITARRRKHIKLGLGTACAIMGVLIGVGAYYGDKTGLFYGEKSLSIAVNGETYMQPDVVKYNQHVQVTIPNKKGYDCVGVFDSITNEKLFDETGKSLSIVSNRDLSDYETCNLEIVYVPHVYEANIVRASNAEIISVTYTIEDSALSVLDEPQKLDGYIFDGWFTDSKYTKPFTGNFADYIDLAEPLTLYPHYRLDGWSINWDLNGGNFVVNSIIDEYTIMSDLALPGNDIVEKTGYKLKGWSLDGKLIDYFTPTIMKDTTLSAVWEEVHYEIDYELNGGQFEGERSYTITDEFILGEPLKNGYRFEGWYLNSLFTKQITIIELGSVGNKTLYAKWTPITYLITYDLGGGVNSSLNPTSYTAEQNVKLFAAERNGYTFAGWYKSGTAESKTELSAVSDENILLVASWQQNSYQITVNPNNGSNSYILNVKYDNGYSIEQPILEGYTFTGFSMGGKDFEAAGIYNYTTDISIIANFKANTYNIIYVSDGVTVYNQPVDYGQQYMLYVPGTKLNHEFVGWSNKRVGGTLATDSVYTLTQNSVLYAVWLKVKTINLKSDSLYTIDNTIEKAYVIGNYSPLGKLMCNVQINILARDHDLTLELINVGIKGKPNSNAINCENSAYTLTVQNSGISKIEGGDGTNGANGVSDSKMTADNRNGSKGNDGRHALNCGRVIFESVDANAKLTLQGGSGGRGGNGGTDNNAIRLWLNYLPNGGNGGNSGAAIYCVSYSVNNTTVSCVRGEAGAGGEAGYRSKWINSKCYGKAGQKGTQIESIIYK